MESSRIHRAPTSTTPIFCLLPYPQHNMSNNAFALPQSSCGKAAGAFSRHQKHPRGQVQSLAARSIPVQSRWQGAGHPGQLAVAKLSSAPTGSRASPSGWQPAAAHFGPRCSPSRLLPRQRRGAGAQPHDAQPQAARTPAWRRCTLQRHSGQTAHSAHSFRPTGPPNMSAPVAGLVHGLV